MLTVMDQRGDALMQTLMDEMSEETLASPDTLDESSLESRKKTIILEALKVAAATSYRLLVEDEKHSYGDNDNLEGPQSPFTLD